jgi:ketosteroid isomerase-like protein
VTTLTAEDRVEIIDTCTRMAWCIDGRDWAGLTGLLADRVMVDYSSTFGDPAVEVSARSFVRTLSSVLDHLTATQHLVASHVVTMDGDGAICMSSVQATHLLDNGTGDSLWTAAGRYTMALARTPEGWRIAGVTFSQAWATGNREVMRLAGRN